MPDGAAQVIEDLGIQQDYKNCENCEKEFLYRKNKRFCSANCRKYANRPTQNGRESPTKKRDLLERYDLAILLGERLYDLKPEQRLGFVKDLIERARNGETQLRHVLSNPRMRNVDPIWEVHKLPRKSKTYYTIAQAANNYCKRFWKANVWEVVACKVPEPETGEVFD